MRDIYRVAQMDAVVRYHWAYTENDLSEVVRFGRVLDWLAKRLDPNSEEESYVPMRSLQPTL